MKKQDLKTGMQVILANNHRYIVMLDTLYGDVLRSLTTNNFLCLSHFDNLLHHQKEFSINKVYGIKNPHYYVSKMISEEYLLWERASRISCPLRMEMCLSNGGDNLAIPFPDGKRALYYDDHVMDYMVGNLKGINLVFCDLVPCKRKDLKEGDTAFRTDLKNPDFNGLQSYCKIIPENMYAYIEINNTLTSRINWKYWYKVVPK